MKYHYKNCQYVFPQQSKIAEEKSIEKQCSKSKGKIKMSKNIPTSPYYLTYFNRMGKVNENKM